MSIVVIKHGGASKVATLLAISSAASERSTSVVVIDDDDDLPWAKEFDAVPPSFLHVTPLTYSNVLQALGEAHIEPMAVLTFMDPAVVLTAHIASHFQVPMQPLASLERLKDKLQMRETLRVAGFVQPEFARVRSEDDLSCAAERVGFPLVLKPSTGGAFKLGVVRIDTVADLMPKFREARAALENSEFSRFLSGGAHPTWMMESYLSGIEVSVEVLGNPGEPIVVAIHEKTMTESDGLFREDQFITAPYRLDTNLLAQVRSDAILASHVLGFERGVGHLEMRVTQGRAIPLELQPVPGGGMISQLTEWSCRVNLHALHVHSLLDWRAPFVCPAEPPAFCVMDVVYADAPGVYDISGVELAAECPGILEVQVPRRQRVRVSKPFSEYLGFIVSRTSTSEDAVRCANDARKKLQLLPSSD